MKATNSEVKIETIVSPPKTFIAQILALFSKFSYIIRLGFKLHFLTMSCYFLYNYNCYSLSLNIPEVFKKFKFISIGCNLIEQIGTMTLILPSIIVLVSLLIPTKKAFEIVSVIIACCGSISQTIIWLKANADIEAVKFRLFTVYHQLSLDHKVDIFKVELDELVNNAIKRGQLLPKDLALFHEKFSTHIVEINERLKIMQAADIPAYSSKIYQTVLQDVLSILQTTPLDLVPSSLQPKTLLGDYLTFNTCLKGAAFILTTVIVYGIYKHFFLDAKELNNANLATHEAQNAVTLANIDTLRTTGQSTTALNTNTQNIANANVEALNSLNSNVTLHSVNNNVMINHVSDNLTQASEVINDHARKINSNTEGILGINQEIIMVKESLLTLQLSVSSNSPNATAFLSALAHSKKTIEDLEATVKGIIITCSANKDSTKVISQCVIELEKKMEQLQGNSLTTIQSALEILKADIYKVDKKNDDFQHHFVDLCLALKDWKAMIDLRGQDDLRKDIMNHVDTTILALTDCSAESLSTMINSAAAKLTTLLDDVTLPLIQASTLHSERLNALSDNYCNLQEKFGAIEQFIVMLLKSNIAERVDHLDIKAQKLSTLYCTKEESMKTFVSMKTLIEAQFKTLQDVIDAKLIPLNIKLSHLEILLHTVEAVVTSNIPQVFVDASTNTASFISSAERATNTEIIPVQHLGINTDNTDTNTIIPANNTTINQVVGIQVISNAEPAFPTTKPNLYAAASHTNWALFNRPNPVKYLRTLYSVRNEPPMEIEALKSERVTEATFADMERRLNVLEIVKPDEVD